MRSRPSWPRLRPPSRTCSRKAGEPERSPGGCADPATNPVRAPNPRPPTIRAASPGDRAFVLEAARRLASFQPPAWRPREEIVSGEARTLEAFFAEPPAGSALL